MDQLRDCLTIQSSVMKVLCTLENHCIQMYVSQFDTCGSGPGQLHYPTGLEIAIYYVVDGDNHCVFVFTTDGQFVRDKGNKKDQFNGPRGITAGKEDYLFYDFNNNRLVMY